MNLFEFDFYQELKLPRPVVCGLVNKVTKPKGKKTTTEAVFKGQEYTYYELHHKLVQIYDHDEEVALEPGLYWVMDIYKHDNALIWNHYLIILEDDGSVYPVAEFLNCHDTSWVKKAVKVVNQYFNDEELEPITLTKCKVDRPTKKLASS